MNTSNPFAKHSSPLFADRGCDIESALSYAHSIMDSLSNQQDRTPVLTALMVLINTASRAFEQAQGPSPAQEVSAAWVRELVVQEMDKHNQGLQDRVDDIVKDLIKANLDIEEKLDEWVQNSCVFDDACDNRVEVWIENNLDLTSAIESAINDLDLVVRVR